MLMEKGFGERWLLLLPRPPLDLSLHTLRVAYGPSLTKALQQGSEVTKQSSQQTILDVGVALDVPNSFNYLNLQTIFGLLYKLACIICTEQAIDFMYDNEVDIRVFVFQYLGDTDASISAHEHSETLHAMSIQLVAQSQRSWSRICALESEAGESLLQDFLRFKATVNDPIESRPQISRLPGGLILNVQRPPASSGDRLMNAPSSRHYSVAVGGTFDHLHAGHKLLLSMTALQVQNSTSSSANGEPFLTVGITGDELLKNKKFRESIEDWDQRQNSVRTFLLDFLQFIQPSHILKQTRNRPSSVSDGKEVVDILQSGLQIRYVEIFDPYGPTITDPAITALVISAETRAGGDAVNKKRQEKGWPILEVFEVDVLDTDEHGPKDKGDGDTEAFQNKLSSTEIRSRIQQKYASG